MNEVEDLRARLAEAHAALIVITSERNVLKDAVEQHRTLLDKMRHGEDPFGGSAADSADILDAALAKGRRSC